LMIVGNQFWWLLAFSKYLI